MVRWYYENNFLFEKNALFYSAAYFRVDFDHFYM